MALTYEQIMQKPGKRLSLQITYTQNGTTTTINHDNIFNAKPYYTSQLVGTIMHGFECETTTELPKDTGITLSVTARYNSDTQTRVYGPYYVKESKYNADKRDYTNECYDSFLNTMVEYQPLEDDETLNIEFPISIYDFFIALVTKCGFTTNISKLPNGGNMIESDIYTGINYTYRNVFDDIGQATASCFYLDGAEVKIAELGGNESIIGKNLIGYDGGLPYTNYGITLSKGTDSYNISGTATGWFYRKVYTIPAGTLNGSYKLKKYNVSGTSSCVVRIVDRVASPVVTLAETRNEATFNITNTHHELSVEIATDNSSAYNESFNIQLQLITITDTTYEPYENPNITIQDGTETSLVGCNIEGNSYQYTTTGKNLFNKEVVMTSSGASKSVLSTGIRITQTTAGTFKHAYFLFGQSELLGKTITLHSTITNSASNNGGILVWFGSSSNPFASRIGMLTSSGSTTINIPSSFASGTDRVIINFYSNRDGTGNVNDYVDYTDLQIEIGSSYTGYENYTGKQASPNPDYPQEVEVVDGTNLLNINRELGTPSNTTSANTTPRTFDLTKLVKGLSWNNYYNTSTVNSYSINGNSLTVNNRNIYGIGFPILLQSSSYTLSYYSESISDVYIATYKTDGTYVGGFYSQNKPAGNVSYTFTTNDILVVVPIFTSHTADTDITYTNIQLEKGTTVSEYVPYNNIGVNVVGKNLLDLSNCTFNNCTNNNGVITSNISNSYYCKITTNMFNDLSSVGKTFTFSFKDAVVGRFCSIVLYGTRTGGQTYQEISSYTNQNKLTFTIASDFTSITTTELRFNRQSTAFTDTTTTFTDFMLEKGETASNYVSYSNITTPIDLQGNFIGKIGSIKDELNIDDLGNVILTKRIGKVVLNGSEDWTRVNYETANNWVQFRLDLSNSVAIQNPLSNYFKGENYATIYSQKLEAITIDNSSRIRISFDNLDISTVELFKTWLSTHNTIVYYVLATHYQVNLGKVDIILNEGTNYITFLTGLDSRNTIEYRSSTPQITIDDDILMNKNIEFVGKVGPINSIIITRAEESDSIYKRDETATTWYEYKIADNQLMNNNDRDTFIDDIYHKLYGITYDIYDCELTGYGGFEPFTKIRIDTGDNQYNSYVFNNELIFNQGFRENIFAEETEQTQSNYQVMDTTDKRVNEAYLILNKQNRTLTAQVERMDIIATHIDETNGNVTEVTTTTGFTFNADGLNIYTNDNTYNTQINNVGTYYKDGTTILSQTTKDGTKTKDLDIFGYNRYCEDDINDDPQFIAVKYMDANNEEGYGHFYNGV